MKAPLSKEHKEMKWKSKERKKRNEEKEEKIGITAFKTEWREEKVEIKDWWTPFCVLTHIR